MLGICTMNVFRVAVLGRLISSWRRFGKVHAGSHTEAKVKANVMEFSMFKPQSLSFLAAMILRG